MDKQLTVIAPIIRTDLIEICLEKFYKYTDIPFYFYIIDQSVKGVDATKLRNKYKNLMVIRTPKSDLHHTGNLGFAQATNLGISLVQTPYFMMLNDDAEMVNKKWWQGIVDTFDMVEQQTPERPAAIVNLASIRLADWSVGRAAGDDFDILPYKEEYTEEDWDFLVNKEHYINEHLTIMPGSVFDGVTMYASVCHTQRFLEVGMLDEKFFHGSGEDYDWSCRSSMMGYRSVCTTLSWVFHHWSSSLRAVQQDEDVKGLAIPELNWNNNNEKWGEGFDIWGVKCPKYMGKRMVAVYGDDDFPDKKTGEVEEDWWCGESMRCPKDNPEIATCPKHPEEVYNMPESTITPL